MTHVPETYTGGPDPLLPSSAYGEGKRVSEWLCSQAATENFEVKIARVFALVGPHLPLDKHFAIGNFLRSAMAGEQIVIQGDGTPYRSYLYAADMAAWLWSILIKGKSGRAYNVGSEQSLPLLKVALSVSVATAFTGPVRVLKAAPSDSFPQRYVPNTRLALEEFELASPLSLDVALKRTAAWCGRARTDGCLA
jgi:dTDP-glucose 4,6-dehydratase